MKLRTLLFATLLIGAGMTAQAQLKITFNPVIGETYTYRINTVQTNKMIMDQEMNMSSATELMMEMKIREKNGNDITLDYAYKEVVMTIKNNWMDLKFDSKNKDGGASEPEKLMAQIFNCLIGKTVQVVLSADGSVKSISGFDAISGEMRKVVANSSMGEQMASIYLQSFNEDAMKNSLEQTFKLYPDREIKAGDSWNNEISLSVVNMLNNVKNTYTLKSVSNDIASIDVVSITQMKATENIQGEVKGEQKGDIRLNIKTGMPVQSTITGTAKGTFSAQGMDFSSEITTRVTTALH